MEMIEPTDPYERGFIDGMAKQRDSAVQRFVEGGTPDSELAEHKRIIREQQAEIGALKQIIDANNLNQNIGQFVKPAENEPVAWFEQDLDMKSIWYQSDQDNPNAIPLYTHPMRELTDEKIWKLWQTHLNDDITVFARALLKKAREK